MWKLNNDCRTEPHQTTEDNNFTVSYSLYMYSDRKSTTFNYKFIVTSNSVDIGNKI